MSKRKMRNALIAWTMALIATVTSVPIDVCAVENIPYTQTIEQEETGKEDAEETAEEQNGETKPDDEEEKKPGETEEDDSSQDKNEETGDNDKPEQDDELQDNEEADTEIPDEDDGEEEDTLVDDKESISDNSISENTIELDEGMTTTRVFSKSSLGGILAQNVQVDNSQSSLEEYGVSQVEINGSTATVSYKAVEDADLVVAVYEEDSRKMVASGHELVQAHGMSATVVLDLDTMPQYYIVKAYLTDPISQRPLCREYKDEDHTKIMQEFYAKKESEFDQNRLYSLDESEDNNFCVFGEDILIFHEGETDNQILSADEDNQIYEFDNAEKRLQNVQPGQIIAYYYKDQSQSPIIAKVYEIQVNGTKVKITAMDTSMEEVFEFVKIDTNTYSEENSGGYSVFDAEDEGSGNKSFQIKNELFDVGIEINANVKFQLWQDKVDNMAELTLELAGHMTMKVESGIDNMDEPLSLGKASVPLGQTGLFLQVSVGLVYDINAAIDTTITFDKQIGARVVEKDGKWSCSTIDSDWNLSLDSGVEGEAFCGFQIGAKVSFINENLASIGAIGNIGPKFTASMKSGVSNASTQHLCTACISGEFVAHGDLKFQAVLVGKEIPILEDYLSANIDVPIGQFYFSLQADPVFGWGECPNQGYYCVVTVQDKSGNPVSGAVVNGDSSLVTNQQGKVKLIPPTAEYIITASKDGVTGSAYYHSKRQVIIKLGVHASQVKVKQVELSGSTQAVVTEEGQLFMWGYNYYGQLGNGVAGVDCKMPTLVKGLENIKIREVQLDSSNSAVITADGQLYMCGSNHYGQLGIGSQDDLSAFEKPVPGLTDVIAVDHNIDSSWAAITRDGQLYMWGYNGSGQLGDGTSTNAYSPVQPKFEEPVRIARVACGRYHTVALSTDGQVYTWGSNSIGQLGNGNTTDSKIPVRIEIEGGKRISKVYAGLWSTAALTEDGQLYMWGNNRYGQLGDGSTTDKYTPVKVEFPSGNKVKEFVLDYDKCMALLSDGSVWAWGKHDNSASLGTGESEFDTYLLTPTKVKNLTGIAHIDGDGSVWLAINRAGELYTWGRKYSGHDNYEIPASILTNVKQAKAAWYICSRYVAITQDGMLYAWGDMLPSFPGYTSTPTFYDFVKPVNETYKAKAASMEELSDDFTADSTGDGVAQFNGLTAGETYNFYVMKDREAEKCLSSDNLLYIEQGEADSSGNLSFQYELKESYASAVSFVVAMNQRDISGATVELTDVVYTGEELYPEPTVTDQGQKLVLGRDYELDGDYIVQELGDYEIIVRGIGRYQGTVQKSYKVVEGEKKPDDPDPDNPDPDDPDPDDPDPDNPDPDDPDPDDPEDHGDVLDEDIPENGVIPEGLWISGIPDQTYTGKAIKPSVRVYDYKTLLVEKKDYTISYKNNTNANDATNAAKAPTITITGKGNYSGKETQTFVIAKKNITEEDVICDDLTLAYNSKVQKPVPVLTWNGKKLAKNKDFTVDYPATGLTSYKEAGKYDITITGNGNYTGIKTISLTITNSKLLTKCKVTAIKNQIYTGTAITPEVVIKDGKKTLVKDTDYSVAFENNTEIGTASVVLTGMGEYTGVKRMNFQIVSAVAFNKAKVTLKAADGTNYTGGTYTGEEVRPDSYVLTVNVKGADNKTQAVPLVEGKDYTVSYQNNVKVGKATIVFTGIGGYKGTIKKTYAIKPYDMKADQDMPNQIGRKIAVAVEESYSYAKGGCKPEPVITFRDTQLMKGTDYTLTYKNNSAVNNGENVKKMPTVIITGKGNFKGKISATFKITSTDIQKLTLVAADKVWQNKGNIYATKVEIVDVDGKKLASGRDYDKTLVYTYEKDTTLADGTVRTAGDTIQKKDIIPAGTILHVTASAKAGSNYTGTISGTYRITQADIGKATVKIPAQTYTGKQIKPAEQIEVMLGGQKLAEGTHYEIVSYANNVNKGTASVTLHGIGDCGGTKTVKFTIKGKGFLWWWRK